jgi:hypothetical protein
MVFNETAVTKSVMQVQYPLYIDGQADERVYRSPVEGLMTAMMKGMSSL